MTDLGWYLVGGGLVLCAVVVAVWLVIRDGEARYVRASRPADLGDVLAGRVAADVPDAVDEQWTQINELFTSSTTGWPACRLPDDQAVRAAGQLPLTWRQRRDLIDRFERIVNPEATR